MKVLRIHGCADKQGFFVDVETNDNIKCAFDLSKHCFSNCAACNEADGKAHCFRGEAFPIGILRDRE